MCRPMTDRVVHIYLAKPHMFFNLKKAQICIRRLILFHLVVWTVLTACGVQTPPASTPTPTRTATVTEEPTDVETPTRKAATPTATEKPPMKGVVSLWHSWSDAEIRAFLDVIKGFRETHPDVQFDVLYVPFDELKTKYESAVGLGQGPSLLIGPSEWGPSLFDSDLIQDVSGFLKPELLSSLNSAAEEEVRYHGATIGLPFALHGVLLFRNKLLIGEAQTTFHDLVTASQSVTRGGYVGAYLDRGIFFSGAHLNGIGGHLMDENGNPTFNNQAGIEWLDLLNSFENAGPVEFNGDQDIEYFQEGKVGYVVDGSWNTIAFSNSIGFENLAIDPWPTYRQGHLSGYIQTENVYLNANIPESDVTPTVSFMEYILNNEPQSILAEAGFIPAVPDTQVSNPLIQQQMDAFSKGTAYPVSPEAELYWDPIEAAMISVFENKADLVAALQGASEAITARLDEIR
jgi:maltose-binding protein MalE